MSFEEQEKKKEEEEEESRSSSLSRWNFQQEMSLSFQIIDD